MGRNEQSIATVYRLKHFLQSELNEKNTVPCHGIFVFIQVNALHLNILIKK
ncbi:hypothetical protein GPAL_0245 [Glaciecola pallidula DSM 14239 = ACAM 615]|jgi:hypothetical protein|uniref:Uncharacterized protein n=1 Tax=Brumicola pallidula DSM 14239 = ACAM 615 TaxID=1121922 RepID=K6YT11_9ALTE|nr:hypothetical protein GPAL_0245 [Glaciecola pallidula DSM 14239 = ACAM 615]